jgi:hypothetical protein
MRSSLNRGGLNILFSATSQGSPMRRVLLSRAPVLPAGGVRDGDAERGADQVQGRAAAVRRKAESHGQEGQKVRLRLQG